MLTLPLVFALILMGCPTDTADTPAKYTVSFNPNGGTITSGQAVQEVEEGGYASIPTVTPPADKEADGWDSSMASIASPASPITANVTFTAKWKDKASNSSANPFIGVWIHYAEALHYKFTETGGTKIYSTATANTFNIAGIYEYNMATKELTLRPEGGAPIIRTYEITNSLLILDKGVIREAWYTKNPETGGGFNGTVGAAPIGGMWQNIANSGDTPGFNSDGEYFITSGEKNRDNKSWWDVYGTYEYNVARKELTLRHNGIDGQTSSEIYTVEFTTADQVMKLTEADGVTITTFNKRDSL